MPIGLQLLTVTFNTPTDVAVSAKVDGAEIESGTKVAYGKDVVVLATPKQNYEFVAIPAGWTKSGSGITRTYTMASAALEIAIPAPTAISYYTLTLNAGENGSITGTAGSYKRGTVVQLTAVSFSRGAIVVL